MKLAPKLGLLLTFWVIFWGGSSLGTTYIWPLGARKGISATFGEYREGHLHAGIDLKTWGKEGYPVYAVAGGWVWRLKTSPWGYGKAVYLKLRDGRYAVYGHLSEFAPRIRKLVEEEQRRKGRYSVEIFPPPGEVLVKRGELIGYSGSTGKGPAHLHFELRDGENRPINPLFSGLQAKDSRPPVFRSICFEPFTHSSLVDGLPLAKIYRFVRQGPIYTLTDVPQIWGKIGCSVEVYDLLDGAENECGVYGLEFFLDGELGFAKRYDYFSYANSYKVDLDWDYPLLLEGRGYFSRLYILPGNSLPLYSPTGSQGFLEGLDPGYHRVKVLATDVAGNLSQAIFKVLVDQPPLVTKFVHSSPNEVTVEGRDGDGSIRGVVVEVMRGRGWQIATKGMPGQLSLPQWDGEPLRAKVIDRWGVASPYRYLWPGGSEKRAGELRFWVDLKPCLGYILFEVRSSMPLKEGPRLWISGQGEVNPIQAGIRRYLASLPLVTRWAGKVELRVEGEGINHQKAGLDTTFSAWFIPAPGGKRIDLPDLKIDFPPQSLCQDMTMEIERVKAHIPPLFLCLKDPFQIAPVDVPFNQKVRISVDIPPKADTSRAGLFTLEGNDWKWVKESRRRGKRIEAQVRHFSTYAVLLDTIKPRIWDIKPLAGSRLKERKPLLTARVDDQGAGIGGDEDVVVWLDGSRVISEWDPERKSLKYRPSEPLSFGYHRLRIEVRDRVGNYQTKRTGFWIMKEKK